VLPIGGDLEFALHHLVLDQNLDGGEGKRPPNGSLFVANPVLEDFDFGWHAGLESTAALRTAQNTSNGGITL
jgi:hypothetical protein